jgi:arylsulfatase A-like enzyme
VIVILLESVRARSTTPYAPALGTTPFLDSLAGTGLLVEQMYAPTSYTNKAIVSAFAGIPPSPEAVVEQAEAFPGGLPAVGLPRLLNAEGYRTAFITPAEMEFERKDRILENLGFSEHFGDGDFPTAGFAQKAYFGFEDRIVFDHTLAWIDSVRAGGRPFFLGMLTLSAHHPYDLPESFPRRAHGTGDETLDDYLNAVTYTDRFLADLHRALDARGLLENTILVVLGDHGEAFAEHGAKTHGDVIWDEALHVPAIVAGPGVEAGSRASGLRTTVDIVPTIAELMGYRFVGGTLPAQSLLGPASPERTLYHSAKNGRVALALRRGSLKYVYWGGRQPMQVFDIGRDPGERSDIASSRDPAELRAVEAELLAWRAGVVGAYRAARAGS